MCIVVDLIILIRFYCGSDNLSYYSENVNDAKTIKMHTAI